MESWAKDSKGDCLLDQSYQFKQGGTFAPGQADIVVLIVQHRFNRPYGHGHAQCDFAPESKLLIRAFADTKRTVTGVAGPNSSSCHMRRIQY